MKKNIEEDGIAVKPVSPITSDALIILIYYYACSFL